MRTCYLWLILVFLVVIVLSSLSNAQETTYSLNLAWQIENFEHQFEAKGIFQKDGFLYVGGGHPGKISKIYINNGTVVWSYNSGQSYQPSYPVSNGHVVVFGTFYMDQPTQHTFFIGLDDQTGNQLWKVPAGQQNMSGAAFADDLVFIGSYDKCIYGIKWKEGTIKWKTSLGQRIWSTPYIYKDMVLIGCYDGYIYSIKQTSGEIIWKFDLGGRINSNPVVINDLAFVSFDNQDFEDDYKTSEVQKNIAIIDLNDLILVDNFTTDTRWDENFLIFKEDIYFFSRNTLYSYQTKNRKLSWKIEAPKGMLAYPIVLDSVIILAMNQVGIEGQHQTRIITYDRNTGKELNSSENGAIGVSNTNYKQYEDFVVTTRGRLNGYKINTVEN